MVNNKQQAAVEWYRIKISSLTSDLFKQKISGEQFRTLEKEAYEQAKEMEKERIETAYNKGTVYGIDYPESALPITGEQYYNETYG